MLTDEMPCLSLSSRSSLERKYIPRPHWVVCKPNYIHQANLLFLTHDTIRLRTYKYALVVVDVSSMYVFAQTLTSQDSSNVAKAFEKIYSRKLSFPNTIIIDPGKEFMGDVTKLMESHDVRIQRSEAKNQAQAVVERANSILSEILYSYQYAQETLLDNERSKEWVKRLPKVLKAKNSRPKCVTRREPDNAVKLKEVDVKNVNNNRPVGLDEMRLPSGVRVRYLFAPGEHEGGDRCRATDPVWSMEIYDISRSVMTADQPILYYLSEASGERKTTRRSFVREELQVIPKDTELPPDHVLADK